MKLFINAHNLRFGGGKTVGFNIINYYLRHPDVAELLIVAPAGCGYERFVGDNDKVKVKFLHKVFNISVFKILSNYVVLPLYVLLAKPDFILSLGNVAIPLRKPQFLLVHQPYLAYPESIIWKRLQDNDKKFHRYITNMLRLIKANLKFVSVLGVQTNAMKQRMSKIYNIPENKIVVVPNAVSFTSGQQRADSMKGKNDNIIRLLYLSKYYPHKNFEVLYEVGKEIRERNLPIKISVTLNADENEGSRIFLQHLIEMELDKVIVNKGNVKLEAVPAVYASHDGLMMPTLLESYSGSYIEAMYFKKAVFTSDMDFAHEVCQDAAWYFNPVDAKNIVDTVLKAFENPAEMEKRINRGQELVHASSTWNDIGKFIDTEILNLA